MYLIDMFRMLRRRWYILLLGAALTAGLVVQAYQAVPPRYQAQASMLMLPAEATVQDGTNVLLMLSGLEQPLDLLVAYLGTPQSRASILPSGSDASFTVTPDYGSRGPLLAVAAEGATPSSALDALDRVVTVVPAALDSLQESVDVAPDARVRITVLTQDATAAPMLNSTLRALILAVGVGGVGTVAAAAVLDGILRKRAQRRGAPERETAPEGKPEPRDHHDVSSNGHDVHRPGPSRDVPTRRRAKVP